MAGAVSVLPTAVGQTPHGDVLAVFVGQCFVGVLRSQDGGIRSRRDRRSWLGNGHPARMDGGRPGALGRSAELLVPRAGVRLGEGMTSGVIAVLQAVIGRMAWNPQPSIWPSASKASTACRRTILAARIPTSARQATGPSATAPLRSEAPADHGGRGGTLSGGRPEGRADRHAALLPDAGHGARGAVSSHCGFQLQPWGWTAANIYAMSSSQPAGLGKCRDGAKALGLWWRQSVAGTLRATRG